MAPPQYHCNAMLIAIFGIFICSMWQTWILSSRTWAGIFLGFRQAKLFVHRNTLENLSTPDTTSCDCVWRPWRQVARRCQACKHGEVSAIPWETEPKGRRFKPGPNEWISGGHGTPWSPTIKEQYKLCTEISVC